MKPVHAARAPFPLLVLLATLGACAAPTSAVRAPDALAPEASRLAQDVRWLAADAREGRRAGTSGEAEAARWIAQRMEALGLEPAGSEGYFQGFEVPLPPRDGGGSSLEVSVSDMRLVSEPGELVPLFCSAGGKVEGPLVFAGYGIADADLGRDDFAGLNLSESIAVIVRGTPPDSLLPAAAAAGAGEAPVNPHGAAQPAKASWGGAGAIFYKVMEAKRRGAKAVIVAQHPAREEALLAFHEGGGAEAKIPAFNASAALLERVLPGYAERVAKLDAGEALLPPGETRSARIHADVTRARGPARNVLGRLRGTDSSRVLVIGAHFDHLGHGGSGSLAPGEQGQIHNGADDNASGTAAVLEVARCLAAGPKPPCDVVFALWSGEELGLLGSEHWARTPSFALDSVIANLNLDMVGRAESGKLSILGAGSAREFSGIVALAAPRAGLEPEVSLSGQGVGGSDHQTFLKREIPALHFFTGLHPDYHRPSDDYERFEPAGTAQVTALVLDLVDDLGKAELAWVPPAKSDAQPTPGGFKTRFGSIPDYAFDGTGMRLDGTSPGGPAEKAGLLRGDVIVAVGDTKIDALGDFMHALNSHKPGDVVTVRFLRDGAEETCQVTLESSQVE